MKPEIGEGAYVCQLSISAARGMSVNGLGPSTTFGNMIVVVGSALLNWRSQTDKDTLLPIDDPTVDLQ